MEKKKKYSIGYTAGVFDLFHVGHLNILQKAKEYCDFLIVAISTDELVLQAKHKKPQIPFADRSKIVESIKYVDMVVPQTDYEDKITPALKYNIDVMFVGSDWKGTDKWKKIEVELKKHKIDLVFLPHTDGISTTIITKRIQGKD